MQSVYPNLIGEIAKRGIKKKAIAQCLGICDKALKNKTDGRTPFTWPEVCKIQKEFFPDINKERLFQESEVADPYDKQGR